MIHGNKANANSSSKNKPRIVEHSDWTLDIIYGTWETETKDAPILNKRKDYNPDYPYSKVLQCSSCWWVLTWNRARSRNWIHHHYYQCTGKNWKKHKNYSLKQKEVNDKMLWIFKWIKINKDIIKLFEIISEEVYNERKWEIKSNKELYEIKITWLLDLKKQILKNIDKVIDFPLMLKEKNLELENIIKEIKELENKCNNIELDINLKDFKKYSLNLIKHIEILALQKEKPDIINLVFEVLFNERIVFENINYQTTNNQWLLWVLSHQKNPHRGDFSQNTNWQSH